MILPRKSRPSRPSVAAALEIEVEQDGVGPLRLEQRQEIGGRDQRLDPLEQVPQRQARGKRDIGVVVDDDGKAEGVVHATSVARLSGNEQWEECSIHRFAIGTRLAAIGHDGKSGIMDLLGEGATRAGFDVSGFGQQLFRGGH